MSERWRKGSTREWRGIRRRVLFRDGKRCKLALPGTWTTSTGEVRHCMGVADCVHHTRGRAHGDDMDYLVAACTPCNLRIGEPDMTTDPAPAPRTAW